LQEVTPESSSLIIATTTVTNSGKVSATEVVQCYLGNRGASLEQPTRSLQGFTRVTLAPGESKQLTFPLGFDELSFFDNSGRSLIALTDYTVWIGGNSLAMNKSHFRITR
jgi:beta-glucosidase